MIASDLAFASGDDRSAPLFGREREREQLRRHLVATVDQLGRLVLIAGEAGIGKTALIQTFAREAVDVRALVLTGHCYDLSATPPYGPWIEITEDYGAYDRLPSVPEVLKSGAGMGDISDEGALFTVAREFLFSVAEERPLVLMLEDAHWSDPASLDLLRYVSRHVQRHQILILVTYRDSELTRDHYLYRLLPNLIREASAQRIDLRPLDDENVHALLGERYRLSEHDTKRLVEYLRDNGEGNPLYIHEILRTLEDETRIKLRDGSWTVGDLTLVPVPPLLRQVIERRVERLGEEHRRRLEDAAVIGQSIPLDVWRTVSTLTDDALISTVERATSANLIATSAHPHTMSFSHALVREALYESVSAPRRRILHVRLAEAIMNLSDPDPDAVAYHFVRAGDDRAADWLIRAGERAHRTYAWNTAAQRFEQASDLLRDQESKLRERGWLLYRTARLLRFSEHSRALELMEEAELIGRRVNDPALTAYALNDRGQIRIDAGDYRQGLDDMQNGNDALDALAVEYRTSREIRHWVADVAPTTDAFSNVNTNEIAAAMSVNMRRGLLTMSMSESGRFADAIRTAEPYFEELDSLAVLDQSLLSAIADASTGFAMASAGLARVDQAKKAFLDAYESRKAIAHYAAAASNAMMYLSWVHLPFRTEDIAERRRFDLAIREAMKRAEGAVASVAGSSILSFELMWVEACWGTIRANSPESLNFMSSYQRETTALALGRVEHATGNPDTAWSYIERVLPRGLNSEPLDGSFAFALEAQPLAAHLCMDAGDLETAREWIALHDRWLSWSAAARWFAAGELLWARYYTLVGDRTAAKQHAERSLELARDPRQPLALVAAHRTLGELKTESGDPQAAETHLRTSLDVATACAAPFECALTLLSLAELKSLIGDIAEAKSLLDQVVTICQPLSARPTLRRADALRARLDSRHARASHPVGLTAREVEVLRLVTRGMSDREIAEELFISHHTVMRHVSHILAKLEVESRTAAAASAVRLGIE